MRTDLYSAIHKAQRVHLFELSAALARADVADPAQAQALGGRIGHLLAHLRDHAQNEARHIHPLFAQVGAHHEALDREHDHLEALLTDVEQALALGAWGVVYRRFNALLGTYLQHLEAEETAQAEILWPHFDDAALGAVMARFLAGRSPEQRAADLAFMVPALSIPELVTMFSRMRKDAPAQAFLGACDLARGVLAADRWSAVEQGLLRAG